MGQTATALWNDQTAFGYLSSRTLINDSTSGSVPPAGQVVTLPAMNGYTVDYQIFRTYQLKETISLSTTLVCGERRRPVVIPLWEVSAQAAVILVIATALSHRSLMAICYCIITRSAAALAIPDRMFRLSPVVVRNLMHNRTSLSGQRVIMHKSFKRRSIKWAFAGLMLVPGGLIRRTHRFR